jgi:hypothetical protein
MPSRPLKNASIGFRTTEKEKATLDENALTLGQELTEIRGPEDLTTTKVLRFLVDAFNNAMAEGIPEFPFKLQMKSAKPLKGKVSPKARFRKT